MKTVVIILITYYVYYVLAHINELGNQKWFLILLGEVTLSASVCYIFSRCNLAYVDYCMLQLMVTRISILILLLKLINEKAPGFEDADIKQL